MVGMIANISDLKDTSFLSIDKALSNEIKFSLLKNGVFLYYEQHFHDFYGNAYTLSYTIDGSEYKSYKVWEDEKITPENGPAKEGYTFSGWSEMPETMPAHDVTVTGSFSINLI